MAELAADGGHLSPTGLYRQTPGTAANGLRDKSLAQLLAKDIAAVSPETTVRLNEIEFGDPWDFERVYETLFKFARTYPFDADTEDYL